MRVHYIEFSLGMRLRRAQRTLRIIADDDNLNKAWKHLRSTVSMVRNTGERGKPASVYSGSSEFKQ